MLPGGSLLSSSSYILATLSSPATTYTTLGPGDKGDKVRGRRVNQIKGGGSGAVYKRRDRRGRAAVEVERKEV